MTGRTGLLPAAIVAAAISAGWVFINQDKPLSIDDPFFMYWAREIKPLAGDKVMKYVNWIRFEEPLQAETNHYMPGWSILLAHARALFGENERVMHWIQWPFATAFLTGVFVVGRALGAPPWSAMLLCASSPLFLLPAASVMPDLPAMGLALLGLAVWVSSPSLGSRVAAGILLGLAGWFKQSILVLYPLLLLDPADGITRRPRDWIVAACSLILAGWYPDVPPHDPGRASILGHVLWILQSTWNPPLLRAKIGYLLATVGALALTPAAFGFAFAARRAPGTKERAKLLALGVLSIPLLSALGLWKTAWIGRTYWQTGGELTGVPGTVNTLWFYLAIALLLAWGVLAFRASGDGPAGERETGEARWIRGWLVLACAGFVVGTFFPASRHLLPILPAIAIAYLSDLRRSCSPGAVRTGVVVAVAANLWLGLSLARSDYIFARWSRDTATAGAGRAATAKLPLMTTASWGLRYYAERAGGRMLDSSTENLPGGAVFLIPSLTDRRVLPAALRRRGRLVETLRLPPSRGMPLILPVLTVPPVRAMAAYHGGHVWFPYAFTRSGSETVRIMVIPPLPRGYHDGTGTRR